MGWTLERIGLLIAAYSEKPAPGYEPFVPSAHNALRAALRADEVLLIEGSIHVSGVIKYLTQSTWSHPALYVGPLANRTSADGEPHVLIEANIGEGVVSTPLSKYDHFHTRCAGRSGSRPAAAPRFATRPSRRSASPTIYRTSSIRCVICLRCRSAGVGA